MRNSIKKIALGVVAVSAFALTACMSSGSNVAPNGEEGYATMVISTKTAIIPEKASGLAKTSASSVLIDSLHLRVQSLTGTALDTTYTLFPGVASSILTVPGDSLVASTSTAQDFGVTVSLRALRRWKVTLVTFSDLDTIHFAQDSTPTVRAGEKYDLNLNANALYADYQVKIKAPTTVGSGSVDSTQTVQIKKISMIILDGAQGELGRTDSTSATYYGADTVAVRYERLRLSTGSDSVVIELRGKLPDANTGTWASSDDNLLYRGGVKQSVLQNNLNNDAVTPVTLTWVGPTTGAVDLAVYIGKVGVFEIVATPPTNPLPKR